MSQVSYGMITITDTNDIESITIEYARNQSTSNPPDSETGGWSTTRPAWAQGYYIWQRARIHKSGTPASQDIFGTAVCLTGSTGSTGAAGRSLTATETKYAQVAANSTETQVKALAESRWTTNVPAYSESLPEYWVRVINTYSNPAETEKIYYKDSGLTSAVTTAASANSTAQAASGKADDAWDKANSANNVISDLNQYFWRKKTASTNVPAGSYVTNIPGTTYEANPAQGGFNSLVQSSGIFLRNGISTLSSWTGDALTFFIPSGKKGLEITAEGIDIYNPNGIKGLDIKDNGLTIYSIESSSETESASIHPIVAIKQDIFTLGFDLTELDESFDPYSEGNEEPFIVWKKDNNGNTYLYEYLDDIIIKDSNGRYALKEKINTIEQNVETNAANIININGEINDINNNIYDVTSQLNKAKSDISTNAENISTNANNISTNVSNISLINARINKIKAYWTINNANNHLKLIEGGL